MFNISLADFSHKKELIKLWQEAFGDEEKFISSFLDAYMIPEYNVPVIIEGGEIASALYLIEFTLYSNMNVIGTCVYLFAAATKKEYRNRGYMSRLVSHSAGLCKNRGLKAIFLFPQGQDKKLFDFYSKFGFKTIYMAKRIRQSPAFGPPFEKGADVGNAPLGVPRPSEFRLAEKEITDVEIFDGLYDSYAEFTAKQELAPLKDRLFYFKCASSYLEDPDAHFAIFEKINNIHGKIAENTHNVEKFCYVFYKKYKNIYYIDDIILSEYNNIKENNQQKFHETADILADFILNSGENANLEMNVLPSPLADAQNVPLAMLLPLSDDVKNIADNLKSPVYINMFMNI